MMAQEMQEEARAELMTEVTEGEGMVKEAMGLERGTGAEEGWVGLTAEEVRVGVCVEETRPEEEVRVVAMLVKEEVGETVREMGEELLEAEEKEEALGENPEEVLWGKGEVEWMVVELVVATAVVGRATGSAEKEEHWEE